MTAGPCRAPRRDPVNRAMDNGLTHAEAAELITDAAFYAGWPNAFSALPVPQELFQKRPQ